MSAAMSALDMQIAFEQAVSKFGASPDSHDVFLMLNSAQEQLVRNRFSGRSRTGASIEQNQESVADLEALLSTDIKENALYSPTFKFNDIRRDYIPLPKNIFFLVSAVAVVAYKRDGANWTVTEESPIRRVITEGSVHSVSESILRFAAHQDLQRMLSDPFNGTYRKEPLATQSESNLFVYSDSTFFTQSIALTYIRHPRMIIRRATTSQSSELPAYLHREIVQSAVTMYLSTLPKEE